MEKINGIFIIGKPEVSVIAIGNKILYRLFILNYLAVKTVIMKLGLFRLLFFSKGSNDFNVYGLGDLLKERGWNLNILQQPSSVHLCCTMLHVEPGVADRFVDDVNISVKKVN